MRYVKVNFINSRDDSLSDNYIYRDELSRSLKKYDTVIVPTRHGYAIATVSGTLSLKQVQDKLRGRYSNITASSLKSVAEKIKSKTIEAELKSSKIADLKASLEAQVKKIDEVEKFNVYAKLSPEVAAMLEELKALSE